MTAEDFLIVLKGESPENKSAAIFALQKALGQILAERDILEDACNEILAEDGNYSIIRGALYEVTELRRKRK